MTDHTPKKRSRRRTGAGPKVPLSSRPEEVWARGSVSGAIKALQASLKNLRRALRDLGIDSGHG